MVRSIERRDRHARRLCGSLDRRSNGGPIQLCPHHRVLVIIRELAYAAALHQPDYLGRNALHEVIRQEAIEALVAQKVPDAVYWVEVSGRTPKRVSLHCAPVNVAEGLRTYLFEKMHSVVMTSATCRRFISSAMCALS